MPQAAIVPLAAWLGTTFVAGAATFVATVAVYAAIGAVVGGLTAAVTGGSIGKGMLFGAIGGAVTGGIASWGTIGTTAGTAGSSAGGALQPGTSMAYHAADSGRNVAQSMGVGVGASGAGAGGAAGGLAPVLAQGAFSIGGAMLEGAAAEKAGDKQWKRDQEKMDKLHEQNLETIRQQQAGGGGGGGTDNSIRVAEIGAASRAAELEEQRRQYNVARQDALAQTETRKSALMGMRAARTRGQLKPGEAPGIDRQGNKDIPGLFGEVAVDDSLVPIEGETVVNAQGEEEQPWYGQGGV